MGGPRAPATLGTGPAFGSGSPHAFADSVKTDKKNSMSRGKDKGTKHVAERRLLAPLFLALFYSFQQTLLVGSLAGSIRLAIGPGPLRYWPVLYNISGSAINYME